MTRKMIMAVIINIMLVVVTCGSALAGVTLLHQATLKDGDYGAGAAINTMGPYHGGSPGVLGIVDSPEGVTFTSTEADGRSNALINWSIPSGARWTFRNQGTVSFMFRADRDKHVTGEIFGDNTGFGLFHNGMSAIAGYASRITKGTLDVSDDQVSISWASTDGVNPWLWHGPVILEYDQWYDLGFAWGRDSINKYETWVCGVRKTTDSDGYIPWGVDWGASGYSGTNFGLGDNHERGYVPNGYGSAAGVTFADISIWDEYRTDGDTKPCPVTPPPPPPPGIPSISQWGILAAVIVLGILIVYMIRTRRGIALESN